MHKASYEELNGNTINQKFDIKLGLVHLEQESGGNVKIIYSSFDIKEEEVYS